MICVLVMDVTVPAIPSKVTVAPGWNAVPVIVVDVSPATEPDRGPDRRRARRRGGNRSG